MEDKTTFDDYVNEWVFNEVFKMYFYQNAGLAYTWDEVKELYPKWLQHKQHQKEQLQNNSSNSKEPESPTQS